MRLFYPKTVRMVYRISAYSMALGIIHTALTPVFYPRLSTDALWFAGTGLALVFLGLLNLAAERVWQNWLLNICIAANLIMLVFCALIVTVLPAITALSALVFSLALTSASILARLQTGSISKPALTHPA